MGTLVGAHPLDHPGRGVRKLSEKYSNSYCFSAARILRVDTRSCDVTKDGTTELRMVDAGLGRRVLESKDPHAKSKRCAGMFSGAQRIKT